MKAPMARIAHRFDLAAASYDTHAAVQRKIAIQFMAWLDKKNLPAPRFIVEIGCGTGFLTKIIAKKFEYARILATDIAKNMVNACEKALTESKNCQFLVCDGSDIATDQRVDWMISSMCLQWLSPLYQLLERYQANSNVIAFSLQLNGSFEAWRQAHQACDRPIGLYPCPSFKEIRQICDRLCGTEWSYECERVTFWEDYPSGYSFLKNLRAIGADSPASTHHPASLFSVLRLLKKGCRINYEIGFFVLVKRDT
jgi:SAM-dependent methyltransferase